jgi:hypothetical protein
MTTVDHMARARELRVLTGVGLENMEHIAAFERAVATALADAEARGREQAALKCDKRVEDVRGVLEARRFRGASTNELAALETRATDAESLAKAIRAIGKEGT